MLQAAIQFEQFHMWILSIFQCVWFCQKSGTFICVELYLGLHFYPVVKQACFYAKTMHAVFNYVLAVPLEIWDSDTSCSSFIIPNCISYPGGFLLA